MLVGRRGGRRGRRRGSWAGLGWLDWIASWANARVPHICVVWSAARVVDESWMLWLA